MEQSSPGPVELAGAPWYKTLSRYHWFVLAVTALGWLFDTMDQQLFNLARVPAMKALVTSQDDDRSVADAKVNAFGGYATSIFLIGWATGGIGFGVLGDRIGRAKTMILTILVYSLFTGMSALSQGFWDFALWRFLSGLGVGGEFAVGVSLVAEVMPDKARPHALGLLQALSAVGNITAALISIILGGMEEAGAVAEGWAWRWMFVIGTAPALLTLFIMRRLKEPERWQAARREHVGGRSLGSLAELFGNPHWRRRALVGLVLASSGVIGLWAIGFFSFDLTRSVFRKTFEKEKRHSGEAESDLHVVRSLIEWLRLESARQATDAEAREQKKTLEDALRKRAPQDFLNQTADSRATQEIVRGVLSLISTGSEVSSESVLAEIAKKRREKNVKGAEVAREIDRLERLLTSQSGEPPLGYDRILQGLEHVRVRSREISGRLTLWAGITSVMLNLGAALGIYAFARMTQRHGRRPAFAVSFVLALLSTAAVFWFLDGLLDVFWMIPIMGFCQLALFGGYAIYFPELFPTRLRSTGVSFCYNVGRYIAAIGPSVLGILTSQVFTEEAGFKEPMRYAGLVMCSVFLIGLLALPFAPETKGQPLPE